MRMHGKVQHGRNDDEDAGLSDNEDVNFENTDDEVEICISIFEGEDKLV